VFGIQTKMKVPAFKKAGEHVPDHDEAYRFDRDTTLAILAGFAFNRRVMIQGYHGTGNPPISNRWQAVSTGPASASTWTAISAAST
jgi:hypothetical protein